MMKKTFGLWLAASLAWAVAGQASELNPMKRVRHFMVQMENLEEPGEVEKLAASGYDLLVIDPTFTSKETASFDAKAAVARLKAGKPGRLVLAYADIGEAERERSYWQSDWAVGKGKKVRGTPSFLLAPDEEDPEGDVTVAYWEPQWQALWLGSAGKVAPAVGRPPLGGLGSLSPPASSGGMVARLMAVGFDGLVLDGVESYDDDEVEAAAKHGKVNPARAMVDFMAALRKEMLRVQPRGVLLTLDGADLIEEDPRVTAQLDGAIFEETWFSGDDDTDWDEADGGDEANDSKDPDESTAGLLKVIQKWQHAGVPVLTIDFCLKPENAAKVYSDARREGFVPLVTQASMEHVTKTPPPGLTR